MRARTDPQLPRHGNRSIIVAVSLLKIVAAFGRPATLTEIAKSAGMSPTRTHRYLMGLVRTELLEQNPLTSRYDLGSQALELGVAALGRVDAIRLGTEALVTLTERARIASLLCSWGSHGPTVLRCEQADLASAVRIREGRNLSLLHSASGRIFLAYLPSEVTQPLLNAELRKETKNSLRGSFTRSSSEKLKQEIRASGLAVAVGEENPALAAISAPIFDSGGRLALSLTLIDTVTALDSDPRGRSAQILKETASRLSRRLGWSEEARPEAQPPTDRRGRAQEIQERVGR